MGNTGSQGYERWGRGRTAPQGHGVMGSTVLGQGDMGSAGARSTAITRIQSLCMRTHRTLVPGCGDTWGAGDAPGMWGHVGH